MEGEEMRGRDIPMELMIEILVYLLMKFLLRFTCVSKSWLSLIRNDRCFAMRQYLQKRASPLLMDNVDNVVGYSRYLRASQSTSVYDEVKKVCMFELTEKKTFRMVKKLDIGSGLFSHCSNFCHGIMCIQVFPCNSPKRNPALMLLCNPSIGEVLQVPTLNRMAERFGIGFDSFRDDYKIVGIVGTSTSQRCTVDVYSVRKGCWHSLCSDDIALLYKFSWFESNVVLNANDRILNLMGVLTLSDVKRSIVSFDMVDEVFWETLMPECGCASKRFHELLPSSRWCVCVCCFPHPGLSLDENESIDIWVLDDFESCRIGLADDKGQMWFKWVSIRFPEQEVVWPMNVWVNDRELFVYVG